MSERSAPIPAINADYQTTNGIRNAANYHQVSFEETYLFSPRTAIYFLPGYQRAGCQTLSSSGGIINAVAAVVFVTEGFFLQPA